MLDFFELRPGRARQDLPGYLRAIEIFIEAKILVQMGGYVKSQSDDPVLGQLG